MQDIISLLKKESALSRHNGFKVSQLEVDNCAVIIEPREHALLEPVIRNVMTNLADGWNLHVFCGNKNYEYVKNLFPDWEFKITNLEINDLSEEQYNALLKSEHFWDQINEENVLIFQTDAFILNEFDINKFTDFSFIGSPYNWDPHRQEAGPVTERLAPPGHATNMNGGFSFRKRSSMLRCIKEVSEDKLLMWRERNNCQTTYFLEPWTKELAEDVFFHNALAMLEESLPSHEVCANFCHQHLYEEETRDCQAIHGYDKYSTAEQIVPFCRKHQSTKPVVLIYAGYAHEPFNGADYSGKRGVRGSEIGLINLAENLTSFCDVYVGGAAIKEGAFNNVTYFGAEKIDLFLQHANIEYLIINRYVHYFLDYKNKATKTFVWIQDVGFMSHWQGLGLANSGKPFIQNIQDQIDGFVCLSDPHIKEFNKFYELPEDKIYKIGNGLVNADYFNKDIQKIPNRFIYSSLPERGLNILLDWFPAIKKELPDAELHVFTDLGVTPNNESPEDLKKKMQDIEGVIFRGKVSNEVMLDEFMKADVFLYPNIFFETFCTSALEAQAAGCIVVTRKFGALEEVVADRGILIDGEPHTEQFKNEAIRQMLDVLKNKEKKEKLQKYAKEWALQKTWENRSLEWIELLQK
jgi:glycosyltransferase involved in cell wall biosynthesis